MAELEVKKQAVAEQAPVASASENKNTAELLSAFGGFNAIRGFMPDADNLNPAKKSSKSSFLNRQALQGQTRSPNQRH